MLSPQSDAISSSSSPTSCAAGKEGGLVTSHCCNPDNMQLFTAKDIPEA